MVYCGLQVKLRWCNLSFSWVSLLWMSWCFLIVTNLVTPKAGASRRFCSFNPPQWSIVVYRLNYDSAIYWMSFWWVSLWWMFGYFFIVTNLVTPKALASRRFCSLNPPQWSIVVYRLNYDDAICRSLECHYYGCRGVFWLLQIWSHLKLELAGAFVHWTRLSGLLWSTR